MRLGDVQTRHRWLMVRFDLPCAPSCIYLSFIKFNQSHTIQSTTDVRHHYRGLYSVRLSFRKTFPIRQRRQQRRRSVPSVIFVSSAQHQRWRITGICNCIVLVSFYCSQLSGVLQSYAMTILFYSHSTEGSTICAVVQKQARACRSACLQRRDGALTGTAPVLTAVLCCPGLHLLCSIGCCCCCCWWRCWCGVEPAVCHTFCAPVSTPPQPTPGRPPSMPLCIIYELFVGRAGETQAGGREPVVDVTAATSSSDVAVWLQRLPPSPPPPRVKF